MDCPHDTCPIQLLELLAEHAAVTLNNIEQSKHPGWRAVCHPHDSPHVTHGIAETAADAVFELVDKLTDADENR